MEIDIPTATDVQNISELYKTTLTDLFEREGILESHANDLESELSELVATFSDFISGAEEVIDFRIARDDNQIIGTAAIGEPNRIIQKNLKLDFEYIPEIKAVYILPDYQTKGAGKLLFETAINLLKQRGYQRFCLDCGYRLSQPFWEKLLGSPTKTLKDYWGKGSDHKIWVQKIAE